jgi:predicted kinase
MDKLYQSWFEYFDGIGVIEKLRSSQHGVTEHDVLGNGNRDKVLTLNPWHHEGVWDHIHMVYENSIKTGNEYVKLLALAHDVAKDFQRFFVPDKNRVRFAGHEYASALFSINFLREQGIKGDDLVSLLKILTLHVASYNDNAYEYDLNYSEIDLLKMLNTCDNAGRICANPRELDFKNWVEVDIEQSEETDKPVYTICIGLPCSGKSTYASNEYNGRVFSTDSYMETVAEKMFGVQDNYNLAFQKMFEAKINWVGQLIDNSLKYLKETGEDCLLDATNLTKKKRKSISDRARKLGAHVEYVMFWRDFSECVTTIRPNKTIPRHVFKSMLSSFTYPKKYEYDSIRHIVV